MTGGLDDRTDRVAPVRTDRDGRRREDRRGHTAFVPRADLRARRLVARAARRRDHRRDAGPLRRGAQRVPANAWTDRARLLVHTCGKRRCADRAEDQVRRDALQLLPRDALGDARSAGHRERDVPLRRARGPRDDRPVGRAPAHLHEPHDGVGRASDEPRRPPRGARGPEGERGDARARARSDRAHRGVLQGGRERAGANGLFRGDGARRHRALGRCRDLALHHLGRAGRGARRGRDRGARQRRPANQLGPVRPRVRRREAVRAVSRRAAPADRRCLRNGDHVRVHRRPFAPAGRRERDEARPAACVARDQLPRGVQ